MNQEELISYLDDLLLEHTGKHLDNLQLSILQGVLDNNKYSEIARQYSCTNGHVRDKAYELWQTLSQILNEKINKTNFKATVERLGFANNQHQIIINPIQVEKINLCQYSEERESQIKKDFNKNKSKNKAQPNTNLSIEIKTIKKLYKLGLTIEQIADALELSLDEIEEFID